MFWHFFHLPDHCAMLAQSFFQVSFKVSWRLLLQSLLVPIKACYINTLMCFHFEYLQHLHLRKVRYCNVFNYDRCQKIEKLCRYFGTASLEIEETISAARNKLYTSLMKREYFNIEKEPKKSILLVCQCLGF